MSDNDGGDGGEPPYHGYVSDTQDPQVIYHAMATAESFVCEQLESWGLGDWAFRWDYARCRLGSCRYDRRQITLSKYFVGCNPDQHEQIRDTVLHEIAHALAWIHSGEKGHGKEWKAWCLRVGALPRASVSSGQIASLPHRYLLKHTDTGEIFGRYYRRPRFVRWVKRMMIQGRSDTLGKLEVVDFSDDD